MAPTWTAQELAFIYLSQESAQRPIGNFRDVGGLGSPVDVIELKALYGPAPYAATSETFAR